MVSNIGRECSKSVLFLCSSFEFVHIDIVPDDRIVWNKLLPIFFLSFRRVVNVIYSFLGNSPASWVMEATTS